MKTKKNFRQEEAEERHGFIEVMRRKAREVSEGLARLEESAILRNKNDGST